MESVSDKLKSLGVALGSGHLPKTPPPRESRHPIETIVDGQEDVTPLGNTFYVRNIYPADYRQGRQPIQAVAPSEILMRYCGLDAAISAGLENCVFMDTETSGLSGGSGTFAFMIGLGHFTAEGFRLVQLFLRDPGQEAAFLASLGRFVADFEFVVTFNGKAFDVPLLRARHILNTFESPFQKMAHIDLLPMARKLWRQALPSRALLALEQDVLGFSRTLDDIPGCEVPQIYFDYLRSGDATALNGVFYHNAMDIISLAALFNHINQLMCAPYVPEVYTALELAAVGRIYEDLGMADVALALYQASLAKKPPATYLQEYLLRGANLLKRYARWEEALAHWLEASRSGNIAAMIELAKYHEHHRRDYSEAIKWTQTALDSLCCNGFSSAIRNQVMSDLQHRLERLHRKRTQPR